MQEVILDNKSISYSLNIGIQPLEVDIQPTQHTWNYDHKRKLSIFESKSLQADIVKITLRESKPNNDSSKEEKTKQTETAFLKTALPIYVDTTQFKIEEHKLNIGLIGNTEAKKSILPKNARWQHLCRLY